MDFYKIMVMVICFFVFLGSSLSLITVTDNPSEMFDKDMRKTLTAKLLSMFYVLSSCYILLKTLSPNKEEEVIYVEKAVEVEDKEIIFKETFKLNLVCPGEITRVSVVLITEKDFIKNSNLKVDCDEYIIIDEEE